MIRVNQHQVEEKKVKGKAGFEANESRFGGWEREMRASKSIAVPSIAGLASVTLRQGWNDRARSRDAIRVTLEEEGRVIDVVVTREDLEQALCYLAQGDEMIKYVHPRIGKGPTI